MVKRNEFCGVETPWGVSDGGSEVKAGIKFYDTPSHGGALLSESRARVVAEKFRDFAYANCRLKYWYEEDCEICVVLLCFADEFAADELRTAVKIVEGCARWEKESRDNKQRFGASTHRWECVAWWLEHTAEGRRVVDRVVEWEDGNKDLWERGGMGSVPRSEGGDRVPTTIWAVDFYRVRDNANRRVLMEYPMEKFYTAEQLDAAEWRVPPTAAEIEADRRQQPQWLHSPAC